MSCEHFAILDIADDLNAFLLLFGSDRASCLHIWQLVHVRITQNETNIRVRNQASLSIDNISPALSSNFDLRNDVPNEFEIDLRHANPGIATRAGHRYGHIWL